MTVFVSRLERIDRQQADEVAEANEQQALLGARAMFALYEAHRKGAPREVAAHAVAVIDALFAAEKNRRLNPGSGESLADLIKEVGLTHSSSLSQSIQSQSLLPGPINGPTISITEPRFSNGDPTSDLLLQSLGFLNTGPIHSELTFDFSLADEADFSGAGWPNSGWIY